ncbi:MAG TPA: hypothetical protein VGC98_10575 [Thermoleophilaceae bacterium]
MRRRSAILAILLVATAAVAALAAGASRPRVGGCAIFPANNPWNQRVDMLPVAHNSDAIVRSIGADKGMHADFGSGLYDGGPIGIPYTTVGRGQKLVKVKFDYADESDKGPYPVPRNAPIEGGRGSSGDRHVIVVDRSKCKLYELYAAYPVNGGASWNAGSGAIWSLGSNRLRPKTWTSADAAGLPILPGLARFDEVKRGAINHALRFTVSRTRNAFVYPARHQASSDSDPHLPPMGLRLRLKAGVPVSRFPHQSRIVLRALQRYGMIVADNGSDWYLSGAPNKGWNNDDLHKLGGVTGGNFEVVNTSSLPHPGR